MLIDFWHSQKQESWDIHKLMKEYYPKLKHKMAFLSIAQDRDKLVWVNTISLDKLVWDHALAQEETFNTFNLKDNPRIFLVNPEGIIVAKDPGLDSLRILLEKQK